MAGAPASCNTLGPTGFFPSYLVPTPFDRHAPLVNPFGRLEGLKRRWGRDFVIFAAVATAVVQFGSALLDRGRSANSVVQLNSAANAGQCVH